MSMQSSEQVPSNPTTSPESVPEATGVTTTPAAPTAGVSTAALPASADAADIVRAAVSVDDQNLPTVADSPAQQSSSSKIRPNALSGLSSYTYVIDLMATDRQGAMDFQKTGRISETDWKTIISTSGGLGGVQALRQPRPDERWFTREYYITSVNFESVVSTNADAAAASVVTLEMVISEPYGINLIQELWFYATQGLSWENYLDALYMLRIQWKGYTDDGEHQILPTVKYIPVKIGNVEIKLTSSGAEYQIQFIVNNSLNNQKKFGLLPAGVELAGTTLQDLITGSRSSAEFEQLLNTDVAQLTSEKNLRSAINSQLKRAAEKLQGNGTIHPTIYQFEFLPGPTGRNLASERMAEAQDIAIKDTPMEKEVPDAERALLEQMQNYQLISRSAPSINIQETSVKFNKDSQILEVLNQLMLNSRYIVDQVVEFRKSVQALGKPGITEDEKTQLRQQLQKPLEWFRIIPKVEYTGKFSEVENIEQHRITYFIQPFVIHDSREAGNSIVPAKNPEDQVVKEFFYFFTGQNTEIENMDLSFDTSRFTFRPSNAVVLEQGSGGQVLDTSDVSNTGKAGAAKPNTDALTSSQRKHLAPSSGQTAAGTGMNTEDKQLARTVADTLYKNVDLLMMELTVLGDPDLIKQDGVVQAGSNADPNLDIPIKFDEGEKYIRVVFKSPKDLDDETGLAITFEDSDTVFNGIYRLISISSQFSGGKFTQTLKMSKVISV